jgi:metal-responsive CopG/Arc/MetJ family transcriptional regulator
MSRPTDAVTVGVEMGPHLLRRIDAVASQLGIERSEAIHTSILLWLEEQERNAACRDRMLKMRAETSRASRTA